MATLTARLLSSSATKALYDQATATHPFLVAAAKGTLSASLLEFFLGQDRIYAAYAYPKFIGGLFRRIDAYRNTIQPDQPKDLLPLLRTALTGVLAEVQFFDEFAVQNGLNLASSSLDAPPYTKRAATLNYVAEMAYVAEWAERWEEGIIFLWAMEKVYLDAWTCIKESLPSTVDNQNQTIRALHTFSAHWSSADFTAFVIDLGKLVDAISSPDLEAKAVGIWKRVLELEVAFWPTEAELGMGA